MFAKKASVFAFSAGVALLSVASAEEASTEFRIEAPKTEYMTPVSMKDFQKKLRVAARQYCYTPSIASNAHASLKCQRQIVSAVMAKIEARDGILVAAAK
ncbi:MAG: UrcA family protein [Pseudomonadota bacterium]